MHSDRQYRAALVAQIALLAYFELCVLVPLGSWNDQPGFRPFSPANLMLGIIIALAQGLLLIGTLWRIRALLWLGLIGDTVWLFLHVNSLWKPYIFGASPSYARMYARVFSRTTKLLPNFGVHLAPDAMHIFIDVFLIAVIVTLLPCIVSSRVGANTRVRGASAR